LSDGTGGIQVKESTQKKLDRVRPPRVQITYDLEIGGAIEKRELPFVVGVLASLTGNSNTLRTPLKDRKFIEIGLENFNSVLEGISPHVALDVPDRLHEDEGTLAVELRFQHLDDFDPDNIAGQIEPLNRLLEERSALTRRIDAEWQEDGTGGEALSTRRDRIDKLLSMQLNEILHAEPFKRLEASWRGLHFLASQTESSSLLRLLVLDVSKQELARDLWRVADFKQSGLYKKICEEEFGTFGGMAFGLLVGDYEFDCDPPDVDLLERISSVAAEAHAPFLGGASPRLLALDRFMDLTVPRDLYKIFATTEYKKWWSFRGSPDSRYVGLTIPRMLLRRPYGSRDNPIEAFDFQEHVETHEDFLWGNAAYALGSCITNAFARYGWCAAIRGVEGGGLVEGLPVATYTTDEGEVVQKCPTEIPVTDRREKELADLGLIPLLHLKGTDHSAFFSMQSCCKPSQYDSDAANANSHLSVQLQYVLTASRFAHYLKALLRDRVGSFMTRADCEVYLNRWIAQYVLEDESATIGTKARFPLREARIDVAETPEKPGVYRAVLFLRPHFQLDELSISMRLVVELPAPAR
jgi:type VI secretion system protein ImpC